MNLEEITKKLKEIRADAYDNATSSEDKSPIQLPDDSMVPLEEDAAGEEVKRKKPKAENVKEYKTLSRATSMDGGKGAKKEIYVTDASLKAPSINELQDKLDGIKKDHRVSPSADTNSLRALFEQTVETLEILIEEKEHEGDFDEAAKLRMVLETQEQLLAKL
jgi:hypothetical protein